MNYRKGNAVKRFHTVNVLVEETVGHHSANVALLCIRLAGGNTSVNLLKAALQHDLAEQYTGDIPATGKWDFPELARAATRAEERLLPFIVLSDWEKRVLKQADMLDICYKAAEEMRMGNQDMRRILDNGISYLMSNDPLPDTVVILKEFLFES